MIQPILTLTEAQEFTALRAFLLSILPAGVEVIRAEVNRVAEPPASDFVVMTPMGQTRLGTNYVETYDNILSGSIAGTTLTVSAITQSESPLSPGMALIDKTASIAANTVLGTQISGTPGDVGTYNVTPSQTLSNETIYAGQRTDFAATMWTVQLDIHGPGSADNTRLIESLFRSEYATIAFAQQSPAYDVTPLYCGEARQVPFINESQQFEYRWSIDACLQINPVVDTQQEFADQLAPTLIEVDTLPTEVVLTADGGGALTADDGVTVLTPDTPPSTRVVVTPRSSVGGAIQIGDYLIQEDASGNLVIVNPDGSTAILVNRS